MNHNLLADLPVYEHIDLILILAGVVGTGAIQQITRTALVDVFNMRGWIFTEEITQYKLCMPCAWGRVVDLDGIYVNSVWLLK